MAIATTIVIGAFTLNTLLYALIYYLVIPVSVQQSPLHFELQKFSHQ